jgi:hypothetical protein
MNDWDDVMNDRLVGAIAASSPLRAWFAKRVPHASGYATRAKYGDRSAAARTRPEVTA